MTNTYINNPLTLGVCVCYHTHMDPLLFVDCSCACVRGVCNVSIVNYEYPVHRPLFY